MKIWLHRPQGRIVQLRWYNFTYDLYKLLLEIQAKCPNQAIEIVGDGITTAYVPIHLLNLENYHMLRRLNV